jgi:hypothetical protein
VRLVVQARGPSGAAEAERSGKMKKENMCVGGQKRSGDERGEKRETLQVGGLVVSGKALQENGGEVVGKETRGREKEKLLSPPTWDSTDSMCQR